MLRRKIDQDLSVLSIELTATDPDFATVMATLTARMTPAPTPPRRAPAEPRSGAGTRLLVFLLTFLIGMALILTAPLVPVAALALAGAGLAITGPAGVILCAARAEKRARRASSTAARSDPATRRG